MQRVLKQGNQEKAATRRGPFACGRSPATGAAPITAADVGTDRKEHDLMSHHVAAMLDTYPAHRANLDVQKLADCIAACFECAQTCTACADACLAESSVSELTQCIRLDLDCADVCETTGRVLSRQTGSNDEVIRALLETCRSACRSCAEECEGHASMHDHCKLCAEACRRCEKACDELLSALS